MRFNDFKIKNIEKYFICLRKFFPAPAARKNRAPAAGLVFRGARFSFIVF